MNIDGKLVNKLIDKYGYTFDMCIIYRNYEHVSMDDIIAALKASLHRGLILLDREVDIEEYIANSYSGYMRRFARLPRSLINTSYGDAYKSTSHAHRALLADKPHSAKADNVGYEISSGHIDHDALSNPWYLSVYKVKLAEGITGVKVVGNGYFHKMIWKEFIDINMLMAATLSYRYKNETLFGRAISLSARSEAIARYSQGKEKQMLTGKGILQEELQAIGLDINTVMNITDLNVSALGIIRELGMIRDSITGFLNRYGIDPDKSYMPLISYLDKEILPKVIKEQTLPSFLVLYKFAQQFIEKERDPQLPKLTKDEAESSAGTFAAIISSYLMSTRLINVEPEAEVKYFRMKKINIDDYKPAGTKR